MDVSFMVAYLYWVLSLDWYGSMIRSRILNWMIKWVLCMVVQY